MKTASLCTFLSIPGGQEPVTAERSRISEWCIACNHLKCRFVRAILIDFRVAFTPSYSPAIVFVMMISRGRIVMTSHDYLVNLKSHQTAI